MTPALAASVMPPIAKPSDMLACEFCGGSITGDVSKKMRGDRLVSLHPECWQRVVERRAVRDAERWKASVEGYAAPGIERALDWPWARVGSREFEQRVRPKFRAFAAKYRLGAGPVVLCGDTGSGKTTAAVAAIHRLKEVAVGEMLAHTPDTSMNPTLRALQGLQWRTGSDIAHARRRAPLGQGEAELVTAAMRAGLLVVDEVGFELLDTALFDVVDYRYREGTNTIVTTGLRPAAFEARYGSACWRRLTERGVVVEEFSGG